MTVSRLRRCSARWRDGDCPPEVLFIVDDPREAARYTVMYCGLADGLLSGLNMSENPSGGQDIGLSFELTRHEASRYRRRNVSRYAKWSSLPESVRRCVVRDIEDYSVVFR